MTSESTVAGNSSHGEYEDIDWGRVSLQHRGNVISSSLQDLHTLPHGNARTKDEQRSFCSRRSPASTCSFPLELRTHLWVPIITDYLTVSDSFCPCFNFSFLLSPQCLLRGKEGLNTSSVPSPVSVRSFGPYRDLKCAI